MDTRVLTGAALHAALGDLARLRIAVFAEWPYLYDGDEAYERAYLATYENSPAAIVVAALDGDRIVGLATGTPMEDHAKAFAAPLAQAGLRPEACFYCAESVLLPAYRGRGLGHAFFDAREAHARALGRQHSVFCAVQRPPDHPARPAGYRPLDGFWRKRGYTPLEGTLAQFGWKDHGDTAESEKPMQIWSRPL